MEARSAGLCLRLVISEGQPCCHLTRPHAQSTVNKRAERALSLTHTCTRLRVQHAQKKKEAHVHTNGYKYTSEMGLQRAQAQSTCSFSAFAQRSIAFKVNPLFVLARLMCFCGSGYCHIRLFHRLTSRPVSQITELWELKKIGQDKEQTQTS